MPLDEDGPRRVGVVFLPRGAAAAEMTDSLTELLIATIAARGRVEIVGKEEFQAALGRDDEGTLACVESDACLGRMGAELGLDELVTGTLFVGERSSDAFRFDLFRLDAASGTSRGRVTREVRGDLPALLGALTRSVDELYVEHEVPGALVVEATPPHAAVFLDDEALERRADGTFRAPYVSPGEHVLRARAPGHRPLSRTVRIETGTTLMLTVELAVRSREPTISPWTIALASAAAGLFAVATGLGIASQAEAPENLDMRRTHAHYEARAHEATSANVGFALGGLALVGAGVAFAFDLTTEEPAPVDERAGRTRRGDERALARWAP